MAATPVSDLEAGPHSVDSTDADGTFVARQPILDRGESVYGYDLMVRQGDTQQQRLNTEGLSARTIDSAMSVLGLTNLTGGKRAFVNVTRRLLVEQLYAVLVPSHTVIQLKQPIEPDAEVIEACRGLKRGGYLLAAGDYVFEPSCQAVRAMVDIVRVDFATTSKAKRAGLAQFCEKQSICLLADKVATREDFNEAFALGYSYFQGHFFFEPQVMSTKELPAVKHNHLRFLQMVNQPQLDLQAIENTLKQDVSLAVRLLRYLNSAAIGIRHKVSSIRQALVLLGQRPLRKWAALMAMAGLGQDRTPELLTTALTRAEFCELIAPDVNLADRTLDLFMMGMISTVDAMIDQPMAQVLDQVPLAPDVSGALLGGASALGVVYLLVLACERGEWQTVDQLCERLGITRPRVAARYKEALTWADEVGRM